MTQGPSGEVGDGGEDGGKPVFFSLGHVKLG